MLGCTSPSPSPSLSPQLLLSQSPATLEWARKGQTCSYVIKVLDRDFLCVSSNMTGHRGAKRSIQGSFDEAVDHNSEIDTEVITAAQLRQKQDEQQKRRRTTRGGRGSSTKTSMWSTIAATVNRSEKDVVFHCSVCSFEWKLNNMFSNSNIVSHYRVRNNQLTEQLLALERKKGTEL